MVNIATATSAYNPDIMAEICELVAESEDGGITRILKSDPRFPTKFTFYTSWLAKNPDAADMYQAAVDVWTMRGGERILEAAYDDSIHALHNKNRMNALQWIMERRNRKQWGSQQTIHHEGNMQKLTDGQIQEQIDALLKKEEDASASDASDDVEQ